MEKQLLTNPEIFPSEDVLKNAMGNVYGVFDEAERLLIQDKFALFFEWRYYKDGDWLCKVQYKKKTIFWLSVWEGFFQTGFFFMERHLSDINELDISQQIKDDLKAVKRVGKFVPLVMKINKKEQLSDLLKIVSYKKGAK